MLRIVNDNDSDYDCNRCWNVNDNDNIFVFNNNKWGCYV